MDELITIPKETAQRLFDALASSMDFGSGFLVDPAAVTALRELAVAIGVDPMKGTPDTFVKHYPHPFKPMTDRRRIDGVFGIQRVVAVSGSNGWTTERNHTDPPFVPCEAGWPWCAKGENHPIHQAAEMGAPVDELITWLRAQLDDDERVAQAASASPWISVGAYDIGRPGDEDADHIVRWDPARVLAEVEAKRRILEAEQDRVLEEGPLPERMREMVETDVIKLLAQPYAGQPGWREEWAA